MKEENPNLEVIELDQEEILEAGRAIAPEVAAMCDGTELYEAIRACA